MTACLARRMEHSVMDMKLLIWAIDEGLEDIMHVRIILASFFGFQQGEACNQLN